MSNALDFLAKARPEAMGHYFAFLKDCGRHLDPKTRNLISLITKVHAQTERGFRQYLKRALREGCTPTEVLDALLMAFPALGLTRIVWAIDQLLALQLPGFELAALQQVAAGQPPTMAEAAAPQAPAAPDPSAATAGTHAMALPPRWRDLLAVTALTPGATLRLQVDRRLLLVHRAADGHRVYDARCPHQDSLLDAREACDGTLACNQHGWSFELHSGQCTTPGGRPLRALPARVHDDWVQAQW
jgi:nitrite reductase/ring-hydroxylating ferredoxin subunit/alkylhydroperoxidase/carboxymuconolactone decarboxylase family protein YurZ